VEPQLQSAALLPERRLLTRYAIVFFVSLVILTAGISAGHSWKLDEFLYVSAARAFIAGAPSPNIEHPPFAKYLIALSIKIFGDNPLGYRFFSGMAGALAALSAFGIALHLTRTLHSAYVAWLLMLANGFLFVESRSANLIIFQTAFEAAGVWAFLVALEVALEKDSPSCSDSRCSAGSWFAWSGILLGLSVASRWCGLPTLVVCGIYTLLRYRGISKDGATRISSIRDFLLLATSSLAAYIASWVPLLVRERRNLAYLVRANLYILVSHAQYRQRMIDARASDPWWAWMFRFEQHDSLSQLLANPVIASLGLLALVALLWQRKPLLPALYALHMLQWALAHSLPQYYYYYLDSFTWLTIALAVAMQGISFKRVPLDVVVTACAVASSLWPLWATLRR
jgi:4-amino-4-deoxy-L-arabinose transferase-like glycosyltransferase